MKNLLILLCLAGFFMASCNKEDNYPEPDFTFPDEIFSGDRFFFINKTKNATSYTWNFGDNTTSADEVPSKTYSTPGVYQVTLTAINENGSKNKTRQVEVKQKPIAPAPDFTFQYTEGNLPATVYFTNTSQHSTSYAWNFGNGKSSTEVNPQTVYTTAGTYTVKLTASSEFGSVVRSKQIIINEPAPKSVSLEFIQISELPLNESWDSFSGPDVFFKLYLDNVLVVDGTSARINDVTSSNLILCFWQLTNPLKITNFGSKITVKVYDYDFPDADDLIATIDFFPSNYTSGSDPYPQQVSRKVSNTKVHLYWEWIYTAASYMPEDMTDAKIFQGK